MEKTCNKKKVTIVIFVVAVLTTGIGSYVYTQHANNVKSINRVKVTDLLEKEVSGQNVISKYASDLEFCGEKFPYKVQSGICSGIYEEVDIKNAFITSVKELKEYLASYETVYNLGENGSKRNEKIKAEEYFDEQFFKEHTLAIEVHNGSVTSKRYSLDSVTFENKTVNINMNETHYAYGGELSPRLDFQFFILDKEVTQVKFHFKMKYINNEEDKYST